MGKKELISTRHATIKEVAEAAGVSLATVSRVLSGHGYSSEASRERVLQAARDLNFTPNDMARSLNLQRTDSVGLVIKNIVNPYYSYLANGVLDRVHQLGYHVIVCATDENEQLEKEHIEMLMRQRAAGIIAVPTCQNIDTWRAAIDMQLKVIFIDRQIPELSDVDTILVDYIRGAHKVMSYLISLGHTRIGIITGPITSSYNADRFTGYLNALREAGIESDPGLQYHTITKEDDGNSAVQALLSLPKPPTAIFAANNFIANGTILALRERKMRVPEDISLVIFDDAPWALINNPPITAVSQPMAAIGHLAMELLDKMLNQSQQKSEIPHQKIIIAPELIIRSSCSSPILKR